MGNVDEISMLLGEIKTDIEHIKDSQQAQSQSIEKIDTRLRSAELRAAAAGGVGGTIMGVMVTLITTKLKTITGS